MRKDDIHETVDQFGELIIELLLQESVKESDPFEEAFNIRVGFRPAQHGSGDRMCFGEFYRKLTEILQFLLVVFIEQICSPCPLF